MAINPVIRYMCDECPDLPAMTERQAIGHVEMHLRIRKQEARDQLERLWRLSAYDPGHRL